MNVFDLASRFASLEEGYLGGGAKLKQTMSTATICIEQEQEMDRVNDLHVLLGTLERTLSTEADASQVVETELHFVDCLGLCEE